MYTLSSDVLCMTDEPAALLQDRRLVYANPAALAILGGGCIGRSIREIFGRDIAEMQAPNFAATAVIGGKSRLLRVSRAEGMQVVFFSRPEPDEALFGDAWLQALRCGLMNLHLAAGAGRRLAEEQENDAMLGCFGSMTREYYRLNRLLSNVSTARSILAEDLPMTLQTTDLVQIVSDLVDSLNLLQPDVAFSFSAERRVLLWADPQLLELLMMNALSNCLCHAEGLRTVRIEVTGLHDRVYLTVRDDGCGIPAEAMSTVFHRYRADVGLRSLSAGAGLGMTVIRGITEAHGGALMLESREGAGTMLRVSLSRKLGSGRLAEAVTPAGGTERLLTGLADCLPESCFRKPFLD